MIDLCSWMVLWASHSIHKRPLFISSHLQQIGEQHYLKHYRTMKSTLFIFSSNRIFSVTREVLRAGPIAINQVLPVKLVGKKSSQGISLAVSPIDGSIVFSPVTETAVATWNPITNEQHILAQDTTHLQFVSDMTVTEHDRGYVYVVSSKFHRFFLKNLDKEEFNNRIIRIPLPGGAKTAVAPFPQSYQTSSFPGLPVPLTLSNYYQLTNSLQPKAISHHTLDNGYFSRPSGTSHPYEFENAGIINYSLKNPFNNLNQGESFPPPKESRNQDQYSFLESLAESPTHPTSIPPIFYHQRHVRNVKGTTKH